MLYNSIDIHQNNFSLDLIGLPQGQHQMTLIPFLPPRLDQDIKEKPYTLILDLDETLGHYD